MKNRPFLVCTGATLLGVTYLMSQAPVARAQQPVAPAATIAPQTYDYELGTPATKDTYGSKYMVKATQPIDSKLKSQRIRFTSVSTDVGGTTTRYFTINTGKYKTVEQLASYLHEAFARFLAGTPANTEVGKVGDIKYGGEVRFVVESNDTLRYDTMTQGEPNGSGMITRADAVAFDAILSSQLKAKR